MFFRMLKKDLMSKKGLNTILFIFIFIASVLVFITSAVLYICFTGSAESKKLYKSSDVILFYNVPDEIADSEGERIKNYLDNKEDVISYDLMENIRLNDYQIDITDFNTDKDAEKLNTNFCFMRQSLKRDLVYDRDDKPFYVKNGEVAVSSRFASEFGAKEGDKIRISNELGYIYEFTIGHFYKEHTSVFCRIIVSDSDYEILKDNFFRKFHCIYLNVRPDLINQCYLWYNDLNKDSSLKLGIYRTTDELSDDSIIADLVSVFMSLLSVFMIILIFLTIRFTVITELKEQEKEIGIMRAVGVDSIKFRWLFSAKYIAFSVIGGGIGIAAGYPAAKIFVNILFSYYPMPSVFVFLAVGISAVMSIIAGIILFSLLSMKKMNSISIMTAIHGETLGERYSPSMSPRLHKNKAVPVSLYLALADITSNFRRYIFLVLTYTLCVSIMLLTVTFRHSIVSENFMKYGLYTHIDFDLDFNKMDEDIYLRLDEKADYENLSLDQEINMTLKENNIPAHYELYDDDIATVTGSEGQKYDILIYYYMKDAKDLQYSCGRAPVLKNEVAMSCYSAKRMNISPGSIIELDIGENEIFVKKEQFVVTGLFDSMEAGYPIVITSPDYVPYEDDDFRSSYSSTIIDSDDKEAVLDQIREIFGDECVMDTDEFIDFFLDIYIPVIDLIMYSFCIAVVVISILITILYLNIFLTEDKQDISLLMNLGFNDKTIRRWQLLKIVVLASVSVVLGIILTSTLGLQFVRILTERIVNLTGFRFVSMPIFTFVIIPLIFSAAILIPSLLILRKIKNIDLRNINEEM
ncbi:MAG TPA: FtsX-like permease family protein [Ruminococcus flavefaciens]|nr:FtsX-like permease family protein [Ruminococcus flavefaciens]